MNFRHILISLWMRVLRPHRYSSAAYVAYLKRCGCQIGEGTYFFDPANTHVDTSRPLLLTVGKYCKITSGVHILTHDHCSSVVRLKYGDILNEAKAVDIGDNVFLGLRTIILPGVSIGSNVIIGAGSVVGRTIPDNVVAAGNPARVITSLEEFRKKRKSRFVCEAQWYARRIYRATGRPPSMKELGDFFPIYFAGTLDDLSKFGVNPRCNGDDPVSYKNSVALGSPLFDNFDSFMQSADEALADGRGATGI